MTKIAIFGVGLIGGSLALCYKGKLGFTVVGHSPNPKSVEKLLKRNVVDAATTNMAEAVDGADYIFLCVPVGMLEEYVQQLMKLPLKKGCIITDVGSTKATITESAETMVKDGVFFIGGHPMAGSERHGVEAASSHLFENAFYVLTPAEGTPQAEVDRLTELLKTTKAQIVQVGAREHDDIVGAISHLPHIIAVALVNQVRGYNETNPLYQNLAAGGFRDITRIASSEPMIWRDILVNNRQVLLKLLADWNLEISRFIELIENSDGEGIVEQFRIAGEFRSQLPERRKGMITSLFDIYVDIPDHPGIIGQITTLLGNARINLSNIQIIESREDVPGILRLSFRNQEDADRASELLSGPYAVHV
ncbi:prephenate dehydrogenase [Paenibacillus chondroitinus]|uniref:Prephenate dehydrogenase n=1 Tax=Paenibacillus chondroitinus TaxID=59842 RepID=A0ABU6DME8_9BACL|nr:MULTISPECIES: prephenate dehydrogenase [Paenibacillus]MCY9657204.1 prephenate dehydrogenase [Paenibacillus anseongense]MEB4798487.1 prephenate dehydrogenase [Paenibacillus chondroitinus]